MRWLAWFVGMSVARALVAEPLLLATFGNLSENGAAGTLTSRFPWRGEGDYVWNRLAIASSALRAANGARE